MTDDKQHRFLGITTLGEKGQVVIPAAARKRLKLQKGDKLMVVSPHGNALILIKAAQLESFAKHLAARIASIKKIVRQ
jgi:AbrB family looped-hinge helix DNA binding protein